MLNYKDLNQSQKYQLLDLFGLFLTRIEASNSFNIRGTWDSLLLHKIIKNEPTQIQNDQLMGFLRFLKNNHICQYEEDTFQISQAGKKYKISTYKILGADTTSLGISTSHQLINDFLGLRTLQAFLKAIAGNIKTCILKNELNIILPSLSSGKGKKLVELIDYLKQNNLLNYTICPIIPAVYVIEVRSATKELTTVLTEQKIIRMPANPFAGTLETDQKVIKFLLKKIKQAERYQEQAAIKELSRNIGKVEKSDSVQSSATQPPITIPPQELCSLSALTSSTWGSATSPHWFAPPAPGAGTMENPPSAIQPYKNNYPK